MKRFLSIFMIMMVVSFFQPTNDVAAYGWGFKQSKEGKPPEFGIYEKIIDKYRTLYIGNTDEKEIYFTFDQGYEAGYTEKVLDVLKKYDVPATFFVTGHYVKEEPELIKRMVKDGHQIGNHSYHHKDFTKISKDEMYEDIEKLDKAVEKITGEKQLVYLRPPKGTFNEKSLQWAEEKGYIHVFWSLAYKDWERDKTEGWKYSYDKMMQQVHPGAIVLLHTVSKDNAEALEHVIEKLQKEGYTFKDLDDLMIQQFIDTTLF